MRMVTPAYIDTMCWQRVVVLEEITNPTPGWHSGRFEWVWWMEP